MPERSPSARALRCPNCGAAATPDQARCAYCQTQLAMLACPTCLELMFEGARFCPHCGARRSRLEGKAARPLPCPRCRDAMTPVEVGDVILAQCAHCDSVWLEAQEFEALVANRDAQAAIMHRVPPKVVDDGERVRYRKCPACSKLMNRTNFGKASGIILDVCRGHGTFLDPGEIGRVVEFIRHGGLDQARAREKEALIEEQRRLRSLEAQATRRMSHDFKADSLDGGLADFLAALFNR